MLKRGVTLTELLITIIIISILSVIIATSFTTGTEAAEKAQLQQMASEISNALRLALAQRPTTPSAWNSTTPYKADRTNWTIYLNHGDSAKVMAQKGSFGFFAPNGGGDWGGGSSDYYGHPTQANGPTSFTPPALGMPLPEKVYLFTEMGPPPSGDVQLQGVPYHPFP